MIAYVLMVADIASKEYVCLVTMGRTTLILTGTGRWFILDGKYFANILQTYCQNIALPVTYL